MTYLAGLVLFALLRLIFLLNYTELVSGEPLVEIAKAFGVGIRFDQIIILYVLLPLLLVIPWTGLRSKVMRWAALVYTGALFSFAIFLLVADIRFFAKFGSHLNFLAYEYIGEGNMFFDQVTSDPGFALSILLWLVVSVVFILLLRVLLRRSDRWPERRSWVGQVAWMVVLLALSFIGIRGGVGLAPIDWGKAYFSHNAFLNQLALNGVYTLARNYTERDGDLRLSTMSESEGFPFVDEKEAYQTVREMLSQPGDEWFGMQNGLLRATTSSSRDSIAHVNVIVVLMESWAAHNTGALGSPHNLTPNFDTWADSGMLFTHFFANGIRTSFGMLAVLGSYPSIPGRSIMGRYDAPHPFTTISEMLAGRGYYNIFVYGGDLGFDNIEGFFRARKYDRFIGDDSFDRGQEFSKWGIPDQVLFERAAALVDSLPRPFQMTVLTLSNHEPYDLPDSSVREFFDDADSSKVFNAQLYADHALGWFLRRLDEKHSFDSTIVVLTADHARYDLSRIVLDPEAFRVPLLILGPKDVVPVGRRFAATGSQVDILPTVLDMLGGEYDLRCWGRDALKLDTTDPGFAMINATDRVGCVTRDYFYMEWLGRQRSLYAYDSLGKEVTDLKDEQPELFGELQKRTRAYMQLAEQLSQVKAPSLRP